MPSAALAHAARREQRRLELDGAIDGLTTIYGRLARRSHQRAPAHGRTPHRPTRPAVVEPAVCGAPGSWPRGVDGRAGVDRKTARRYIDAASGLGVVRGCGLEQLSDELLGAVINAVRPERLQGHGAAWDRLLAVEDEIAGWVGEELQLTNIHGKLERRGVAVLYRTLHRFAVERCGLGRRRATLRVADGTAGMECQVDFGRLGLILDPETGRRRTVHALIFTAVVSRHMFVWLSFRQTLANVIAGCEAAWAFFGGIFKVLVPDNLKPVVINTDPVNSTFSDGWLDYAQARGFGTDPARVRSPRDKPRVERTVQYVRGNFFAGEVFLDLLDAQRRVEHWCRVTAGLRVHGTTAQRSAAHFAADEAHLLSVGCRSPRVEGEPRGRPCRLDAARPYAGSGRYRFDAVGAIDGDAVAVDVHGRVFHSGPRRPCGQAPATDICCSIGAYMAARLRTIRRLF